MSSTGLTATAVASPVHAYSSQESFDEIATALAARGDLMRTAGGSRLNLRSGQLSIEAEVAFNTARELQLMCAAIAHKSCSQGN